MEWWEVSEQPTNNSFLSSVFEEQARSWCLGGKKSSDVRKFLEKHIKAFFLPHNISNPEQIFHLNLDDSIFEICADRVALIDLDFSEYPIPLCNSEAFFTVTVKQELSACELLKWQELNGFFHECISFSWDFPDHELDLSWASHRGAECLVVDAASCDFLKNQ